MKKLYLTQQAINECFFCKFTIRTRLGDLFVFYHISDFSYRVHELFYHHYHLKKATRMVNCDNAMISKIIHVVFFLDHTHCGALDRALQAQ